MRISVLVKLMWPHQQSLDLKTRTKHMSTNFLVTAIVSVYNAERFLAGCLEDLERQTIADKIEIIVIDSGSPQQEGEIVRSFQQRFDNIRYVRTEERETIYEAWNRAITLAQGRYLTNANADDRHRPDALEKLVEALERNPDVAVAYADCLVTTVENENWPPSSICGVFHWPSYDPRLLFRICFIGPQPVWRRSLHDTYGMFDGKLRSAGDYDFWLRLAAGGIRFMHIPEVLGAYLASPLGMELSNQSLSSTEGDNAKRKHWPPHWGQLPAPSASFLFPALTEEPLISVIVPTLNRPHLLHDALLSLVNQTFSNWEAIVINDGGESVTEVVNKINHNGRIKLLDHWKRLGQPKARNTALRIARGQIICYLDDDDRYMPAHLEGIVDVMRRTGSPFVFSGAVKVTESLEGQDRTEIARENLSTALNTPLRKLSAWNFIPLPTWAHRRECINHVGFFDESMASHEDWEFLLRFARLWELVHAPQETVEIRIRPTANDSVTSRTNPVKVKDFRYIYAKNPTQDPDIVLARQRILADLGTTEDSVADGLSRKLRLALDRHVLWRFK